MAGLAISAIFMLQLVLAVSDEGHYTVVGPGTIHSERKYNVAVTAHHNDVPSKIIVAIKGTSYNASKTVELQSGETKVVEFDVPHLEEGSYNLITEDISGMPFKDQVELNIMKAFKPTTVIQTDRGQYKPGDTVNYRLIFLDENLKPAKPHKDTVLWFEDPKNKQMATMRNFKVVKGVFTGKFNIPMTAVLGTWSIIAKVGNEFLYNGGDSVKFSVAKYVLPVYKVEVEATNSVSVKDGDVQVVVRAKYLFTHGQPINAKATVFLRVDTDYQRFYKKDKFGVPPVLRKTTDMVDGRAKFDFDVREWESYLPDKRISYIMTATASVEENFTDVKINSTARGFCYAYRYKMRCIGGNRCNSFHADEEYDVPIEIRYFDGNLLNDSQSVVKLVYKEIIRQTYPNGNYRNIKYENIPPPVSPNRTFVFESYLNASNIAVFKVKLPDLEQIDYFDHFFEVDVKYEDEQERLSPTKQQWESEELTRQRRDLKEWFYVKVKNTEEGSWEKPKVKLGEEATITIGSSLPLPYFVYNIIARGNVLSSQRVDLPDMPKTYEFKIPTTFPMATYSKIYVYYVDEVGDFHSAENFFYVSLEFQNPIEITAERQVKPGQDVTLQIKTTINSFVGLLAVDQSTLLYGANNDYNPSRFQGSLSRFMTRTFERGPQECFSGSVSGVVTLTNANYFCSKSKPDYESVPTVPAVLRESSNRAMEQIEPLKRENAAVEGELDETDIAIRRDFSETWIFANIENTETEEFAWIKKIPDKISSWVVTGFSLHPERGLGITQIPTDITTFRPFYIAVRLPYSVKKGEVVNVPALVFNHLAKDLDVAITLDNADNEYDFLESTNATLNESKRIQTVRVSAHDAVGVSFMIRPKIVGSVMLKFTAVSPMAGDTIHKTLKVEPGDVRPYDNRAYFASFDERQPTANKTFDLKATSEVVIESKTEALPDFRKNFPPESKKEALSDSKKKSPAESKEESLLDFRKKSPPESKMAAVPDLRTKALPESKNQPLSDSTAKNLLVSQTEKAPTDSKTEAVLDSKYYGFSVVGDLLGPLIKDLNGLLRGPIGSSKKTHGAISSMRSIGT